MKKVSIVTFVTTCKKYEQSRAKLINDTWAKNLDNFFFIVDDETFSFSRKINLGPYPKGPTVHPKILIKIFELFNTPNFINFDYLFIVDDDTFVFPKKLKLFLKFFDPSTPYIIGDFINWCTFKKFKNDYSRHVAGGSGIVFSRPAVNHFIKYIKRTKLKFFNHDVYLNKLIIEDGSYEIKRIHAPGFHQYVTNELINLYNVDKRIFISIHLSLKEKSLEDAEKIKNIFFKS